MSANYSRSRKQTFHYLSDLSSVKVLTKDNKCHPAPPGHFHFWKKSRICKSGHVATWSAGDQSQQVRRESASGIVAHFSLMLMIITVATMVIIMIKATLILERRTLFPLFIQTPFGPCLRHLSFVVVSCISWHLPVVIDCISHPPLEIISHKILVWVWMAGQPYLRRLRTLESGWLYTLTTGQLCIGEGGR